jgi:hypothetical protein
MDARLDAGRAAAEDDYVVLLQPLSPYNSGWTNFYITGLVQCLIQQMRALETSRVSAITLLSGLSIWTT